MEYRFAGCTLDTARHRLMRAGEGVHVEPQVFRLLQLLVERNGEVVPRDEIVARVWDGRIVSEATISARISAARAAVGDDGKAQAVIRTVHGVGLQLVAPVQSPAATAVVSSPPPDVRMATSADGTAIAWTEEGTGPPLLRAGHWLTHLNMDRDSPIWGPWIERLGRGRRLVRYDFRGTGMSDPDCGPMTLDAFVEDMKAVLDAAGIERIPVFAASQSAAVSFAFAARYPDRVTRIVSYGGWALGSEMRDAVDGPAMTQALGAMLRQGWGQPDGGYMKAFASLFLPAADAATVQAFVQLQSASATPERAVQIRDVIARFDVTDILAEVRVPVLVIHARGDALHPFNQAQLLARHLPDARLLMVDSANHILLQSEPAFAQAMDATDAFLD